MTTTARQARLIDNPDLLRERLRAAPQGPGVYVMRDLAGRVAYVGKAAVLQNRLRSYFNAIPSLPERTRRLVEGVFDFEVIACASPREALILENTLIKRHRPRFNVRLKDDKNYLYLKIPAPGTPDTHAPGTAREKLRAPRGEAGQRATLFPRPYYTRKVQRDGARYYGPYTSAQSLRTTVRSLRTIFPFRTCGDELFRRGRWCAASAPWSAATGRWCRDRSSEPRPAAPCACSTAAGREWPAGRPRPAARAASPSRCRGRGCPGCREPGSSDTDSSCHL